MLAAAISRINVVIFHDGIGPESPYPVAPDADNTVTSEAAERALFRTLAHECRRRFVCTDDGGPWADVHAYDAWDDELQCYAEDSLIGQWRIRSDGEVFFLSC